MNTAKRASIYLGVFLAVVMIAGVFLPYLNQNNVSTTGTTLPTATILPTFPPPPSNFDAIKFDKVYLHPSGIFSIAEPDGWNASQPNMGSTIAQINLINNTMFSVVDSYIEAVPLTPDQLSAHFSEAVINSSWANFSQWTETNRTMQSNHLIIDFNVVLSGRTYVARQIAWTDGTWIYVVRVLVPENAVDLLKYLLDNFVKSLQPQTEFIGTPFDWNSYYDPVASHIIRYPSDWAVTDSASGRVTSITSSTGSISLRIEARTNTSIADQAAAKAFVEAERSGINVISILPVTRGLGKGFSVAYSYTTVDGSKQSGLAVLLNTSDGNLHIADLLFPSGGIDLNKITSAAYSAAANATAEATSAATAQATSAVTPESTAEINATATAISDQESYLPLAEVMSTFYVIKPLNLAPQSLPTTPTATPLALATLVPQQTSEVLTFGAVTSEATAQTTAPAPIAATSTPTGTPTVTIAATVQKTAQATAQATAAS